MKDYTLYLCRYGKNPSLYIDKIINSYQVICDCGRETKEYYNRQKAIDDWNSSKIKNFNSKI